MGRLLEFVLPRDGVAIGLDNVAYSLDILRSLACFRHYPTEAYRLMFQENLENNDSDQAIFNLSRAFSIKHELVPPSSRLEN
jgi:hypothetical protein